MVSKLEKQLKENCKGINGELVKNDNKVSCKGRDGSITFNTLTEETSVRNADYVEIEDTVKFEEFGGLLIVYSINNNKIAIKGGVK